MQSSELLYHQSEFLIAAVLLALLLLAAELGFRRGRHIATRLGEAAKSQLTTLEGGLLGLLALLLAFTFAMAVLRFDSRLQLVVDESNAIETMTLRAAMLPNDLKADALSDAKAYLIARVAMYGRGVPLAEKTSAFARAAALQTRMWALATAAAQQNDCSVPLGLFISSLNEVFDIGAKRDAASRNHVPESVLILLFVVSILALGATGYGCGFGNHRNIWAVGTIAIVIALVILVIIDLDRPLRGLIRVSQQRMVDLVTVMPDLSGEPQEARAAKGSH
jgi:hypothetical protein